MLRILKLMKLFQYQREEIQFGRMLQVTQPNLNIGFGKSKLQF